MRDFLELPETKPSLMKSTMLFAIIILIRRRWDEAEQEDRAVASPADQVDDAVADVDEMLGLDL